MPAIAAMTINDGAATPVAHSFVPVSHGISEYLWRDNAVSSILSAPTIMMTFLKVKGNASLEKVRFKFTIPALETATGANAEGYTAAPKLAYSLQAIADFIVPNRATLAQKKDLVAYVANALAPGNVQVYDAITAGYRPY